MTALEPGAAGAFLQRLGPAIDARFGRPRAVLAISAHTLVREPVLLAAPRHAAVYDFGGFPDALYQLRYDAPGAPALAGRVQDLLAGAGVPVHRVDDGGLDHGIWTPLRYMYPDADVPVLPLGFVPTWTPQRLQAFGQALAPLAAEGVLIVGTRQHHAQPAHGVRQRRPAAGGRARGGVERCLSRLGGRTGRGGRLGGAERLPPPGAARRADAPDRRTLAALVCGWRRRGRRGRRHAAARQRDLRLPGHGRLRLRPAGPGAARGGATLRPCVARVRTSHRGYDGGT
jgi:hypothetical protein